MGYCLNEDQFPNPSRFDIARTPNDHVAFGFGSHFCLGNALARLELNVAMEEWHRRIPKYRVAQGTTPVRHAGNVIGYDSLSLEWDLGNP